MKEVLRRMFGCTAQSLEYYRISLGVLLFLELCLRFRVLRPFYTDEGTLPLPLLLPEVDAVYKFVCFHCHFGSLFVQQVLLGVQCGIALCFTLGYGNTHVMAFLSWYLYLSLTLRNTWLNYILDRYIQYLLFYAIFLPLDTKQKKNNKTTTTTTTPLVVSMATIGLKLQVLWIYFDAGYGKYSDPLGGWMYNAASSMTLPALDTYIRHTLVGQYMYALLKPIDGLRLLTPSVVWIELGVVPLCLLGLAFNYKRVSYAAIAIIVSLHCGIALTMNNTTLLSLVACVPWTVFLPYESKNNTTTTTTTTTTKTKATSSSKSNNNKDNTTTTTTTTRRTTTLVSTILILGFVMGSLWFELFSDECNQSTKHIWSVLFHNRWNVFVGSEEYVTWEIAPGLLNDGSVVDIWSSYYSSNTRNQVNWNMPTTTTSGSASSTSTSRPGRWRSFPYLAEFRDDAGDDALWSYLCREWNTRQTNNNDTTKQLLRFKFYMLQADVLPNMGFSSTRKRLIRSYDCREQQQCAESESSSFLSSDCKN